MKRKTDQISGKVFLTLKGREPKLDQLALWTSISWSSDLTSLLPAPIISMGRDSVPYRRPMLVAGNHDSQNLISGNLPAQMPNFCTDHYSIFPQYATE